MSLLAGTRVYYFARVIMHALAAVAVTALCVTGGGSAQNAAAAGGSSLHAAECSRDHIKAAISGISACKPR